MNEENDEMFNFTTDEMLEEYDDAELILDGMDDEMGSVYGSFYKKISNGEKSTILYKNDKGDVHSDDEEYIGNVNDNDFEDKLNEYEEEWHEINWTTHDYAEHLGCDDDEVEEVMTDYLDKF